MSNETSILNFTSTDEDTVALILQLRIEEVEQLEARKKGKARIDQLPFDADITLQLYMEDLKRWDKIVADRVMTRSIASAVLSDAAILNTCEAQERLATQDHQKARQMAGLNAPATELPTNDGDGLPDCMLNNFRRMYVSAGDVTNKWEEHRLLARANQVVDRRDDGDHQPRAQQVEEAARDLVRTGNCAHRLGSSLQGSISVTNAASSCQCSFSDAVDAEWKSGNLSTVEGAETV
ncbi:hypothetical protein BBP40_009615 [Aspergillus hancockii]|nr:hypothetical protein BBP40_009615 [Aspergillus hancockii]